MWCDAHNHLHDARLSPWAEELPAAMASVGITAAVVNGTHPDDWPAVTALCARHPQFLPAYGVHPWKAPQRPHDWEASLLTAVADNPLASVGEIGLDAWIEGHNLADQSALFLSQVAVAAEFDRPVTVHCVRAWEPLRQLLRRHPMPRRGFLLHAFSGPPALIPFFVECGAFFSFSPYFLHPRKTAARAAFREVPADRLLIETDSPDLAPPDDFGPWHLPGRLHHPCSLPHAAAALADDLALSVPELAALTSANFRRLFLPA